MIKDHNIQAFFALLQAGLWGCGNPDMRIDGTTDWEEVYRLATEQSVLGLILAGLEHSDVKPPQMLLLQWIGEVQIIEQRNKKMNGFIAELIEKLRKNDIYALLVKGQGVAQCYEKPLWRVSGDVDLLLDDENYQKAKELLIPLSEVTESEDVAKKHLALKINGFEVELHGKMPFGISCRADDVVDEMLEDSLLKGRVSKWSVDETDVLLPNPDNHIVIVFTHFLRHFFIEGVGLRQICDWCRLLYSYRDSLNYELLESRIKAMGLMSEWKAFGALAIEYLGFPKDSMPLLNVNVDLNAHSAMPLGLSKNLKKKADRILELVLESGNFGHNKDLSYRTRYSGITYKIVAAWRRLKDFASLIPVFPLDAPRFYLTYILGKVK